MGVGVGVGSVSHPSYAAVVLRSNISLYSWFPQSLLLVFTSVWHMCNSPHPSFPLTCMSLLLTCPCQSQSIWLTSRDHSFLKSLNPWTLSSWTIQLIPFRAQTFRIQKSEMNGLQGILLKPGIFHPFKHQKQTSGSSSEGKESSGFQRTGEIFYFNSFQVGLQQWKQIVGQISIDLHPTLNYK